MKELSEDIRRWFKEKWTAQDGSPCGSYKGKGEVKCRPSKRVSSKTAQTWGEMSKGEKKKAVRLKQKAHKRGHQFSSHKTGKTWKGMKYKGKHRGKKKKLKEGVEVDPKFLKNFVMDAIKNPRKFYSILTLSGMPANDAYRIVYNLKNPRLSSSSFKVKMQMLHLLQNIIELITKDRILYSRLRSLAQSGEAQHFGKNISSFQKRSKSYDDIIENEGGVPSTSLSSGNIEGIPPRTPADQTPVGKNTFIKRLKRWFNKKPKTDPTRFITVHGG